MMQWKRCQKILNYEIGRFFNNKQKAKLFSTILTQGYLGMYAIALSKKVNKIYLIVCAVCKYRMQVCKLLSSQLLQSLLDVLCTHNKMRLKILETGRTHAVMSACGVNANSVVLHQ